MPILYLAKVNVNSNIYDVYNKKLNLDDVKEDIFDGIQSDLSFLSSKREKYTDEYGAPREYIRESKYYFEEIKRIRDLVLPVQYDFTNDESTNLKGRYITGKLVRTYKKPSEELNTITQKMVSIKVEVTSSIYFLFDIDHEMIAFCERQNFGYNQFMEAFTHLLNDAVSKKKSASRFEIFLEKDKNLLEDKLKEITSVYRVRAVIIPKNSNNDDIQDLYDELDYQKQLQQANATKLQMEYTSENMTMDSMAMKNIVNAVTNGYGDMTVYGKDQDGRNRRISSSQDAAFTSDVPDGIGEDNFNREAVALIRRFINRLKN